MENKTSFLEDLGNRFFKAQRQTLHSFLIDNVFQFLFLWEEYLVSQERERKYSGVTLRKLFSLERFESKAKTKKELNLFLDFCGEKITSAIILSFAAMLYKAPCGFT